MNKKGIITLVLVFALIVVGCVAHMYAEERGSARKLYEMAEDLMAQGEYQNARYTYEMVEAEGGYRDSAEKLRMAAEAERQQVNGLRLTY